MPSARRTVTKWGGLGRLPDLPDRRDWRYASVVANPSLAVDLPPQVNLVDTGYMPSIWNQGPLGSCVPHGTGAALVYDLAKQGLIAKPDAFMPSRLGLYYEGRLLEGTVGEDSGLTISDGIKVLGVPGAGPEADWPYDVSKFTEAPPQKLLDDAQYDAVKYARVPQTAADMKTVLASGLPIVVGFSVYESFESDAVAGNGVVPMPSGREALLGGHCMLVVGYVAVESKPYWIARNSWGTSWGDSGYCLMPEAYLLDSDLADDFWTVQLVTSPTPTPQPPAPPEPAPVDPTGDRQRISEEMAQAAFGVADAPEGDLTFVRNVHGREWWWKKAGVEVMVKWLH
jgi:C1A family cysteine protease